MNTKRKIPATETGATRGDGTGYRQYTTMPKPLGHNVLTNSGRHATGGSLARVGAIRQGQGPSGSGVGTGVNQKTGVPAGAPIRSMAPRPSIPANQAETSKDLEARLLANPQPFTYDTLAATLPTGRHDGSTEGVPYNVIADVNAKPQSYGKPVGCANTSDINYEAIGDTRGRVLSERGYRERDGVSGRPNGGGRQAGMPGTKNTNTSSSDNRRMRQG